MTILAFPEAAAYLKQAKLQGLDAPAYGYGPEADEGLIKLAGDAAEGFHAVSFTKPALDPSPAMERYREALKKYAPSEQPSSNSAAAYAGAMAFAEVVKTIKGDVTPQAIAQAFANAGTIETGMLPPLTWSARTPTSAPISCSASWSRTASSSAEGAFVSAPPVGTPTSTPPTTRGGSMNELLLSLISGISNGAVYGLVGLGLVIIYRSTDVVNFAIGTMALVCMYLALSLNGAGHPARARPARRHRRVRTRRSGRPRGADPPAAVRRAVLGARGHDGPVADPRGA